MNKKFANLSKPYLYWLYILALFPALFMFVLMFLEIPEGLDVSNEAAKKELMELINTLINREF